jgi:CHASE3 domain sensor protein
VCPAWQVRAHQHKACLILIIIVLLILIGVVFYYGIIQRHLRHRS